MFSSGPRFSAESGISSEAIAHTVKCFGSKRQMEKRRSANLRIKTHRNLYPNKEKIWDSTTAGADGLKPIKLYHGKIFSAPPVDNGKTMDS